MGIGMVKTGVGTFKLTEHFAISLASFCEYLLRYFIYEDEILLH